MIDVLGREFYYMPAMDKMAKKHFQFLEIRGKPLPSVQDLEKSISVILVNSDFAFSGPRPMIPGMIPIAGVHIKPVKPLPGDIQKFLDGAENGAVFMSLGSFVQSASMPRAKLEMLLKVFGSLKQRVLWKFETDDLPNLPPNVMVQKWLPQSDVLAHPKVVLFIAHGGLFGTIEASYRGVPTLFIPFYAENAVPEDDWTDFQGEDRRDDQQQKLSSEGERNVKTSQRQRSKAARHSNALDRVRHQT